MSCGKTYETLASVAPDYEENDVETISNLRFRIDSTTEREGDEREKTKRSGRRTQVLILNPCCESTTLLFEIVTPSTFLPS